LQTEYRENSISFLLGLLEGAQYVSAKAKMINKGPRKDSFLEFSHKLLTSSISMNAKELAERIWDHSEFETQEEFNDPKITSFQELSKDKMLTGVVYLIGVFL